MNNLKEFTDHIETSLRREFRTEVRYILLNIDIIYTHNNISNRIYMDLNENLETNLQF